MSRVERNAPWGLREASRDSRMLRLVHEAAAVTGTTAAVVTEIAERVR